jgi:hypothetical protein
MRPCGWWIGAIILGIGPAVCFAQAPGEPPKIEDRELRMEDRDGQSSILDPLSAILYPPPAATAFTADDFPRLAVVAADPPSVYAPVEPERPIDGTNKGGVQFDLDVKYLTDDVYRGISHNFAVYNDSGPKIAKRHASNFAADAKLTFNLDKLPHPFVGVFSNINDSDPVSRFQEIRPFAGLDYSIRPISLSVGVNDYIYPERETLDAQSKNKKPNPNTSEIFVRVSLDDSYFFKLQKPIIAPYVLGVYDYDKNKGWYIEAGIKHDFEFPDFGVTISPFADVAYISHFPQQFITNSQNFISVLPSGRFGIVHQSSSGFQHYDVGLVGSLSLNHVLHLPPRYGQFAIEGYLTYTSKFSNPVLANTEVWGGVGLKYRY